MNEQLSESQNRFLDLFRNSAKEDINNKEFIKNVVISKSGRINYSINNGKAMFGDIFNKYCLKIMKHILLNAINVKNCLNCY